MNLIQLYRGILDEIWNFWMENGCNYLICYNISNLSKLTQTTILENLATLPDSKFIISSVISAGH